MKNLYPYLKNVGLSLFLVLFVTVPIIYYLGVYSKDEGIRFHRYEYRLGGDIEDLGALQEQFFQESTEQKIDLGVISEDLFVKIDLSEFEQLEKDSVYVVEVNYPSFREIELIRFPADGEPEVMAKKGTAFPHSNPLRNPNPFFEVTPDDNYHSEIAFRMVSKVPVDFDISIFSQRSFFENYSMRLIIISSYFGIMIALFLYNLILYFSVRDKVYLFYCFYVLFIALAQLSLSGHSYFFLQENAYLYEVSTIGFTTMSSIFVIPFVQYFLKTSVYIPKYEKYLYLLVLSYVIA
jgi:two-component system, NtrC family, sensor kinase